ncbi:hypothetical protein M501DRAFT_969796 [Patellaria atrata CBS 101060]|uniref:Uncharacterized protein n=1 Tax=Patellaria atrata CBS 101060 TaxID=1346257 RepID=A0A9P4SEL7_9PEZI|nr:hypothetical protein M501DRAFT_969796 [Patellaria atrata CBS 101060]
MSTSGPSDNPALASAGNIESQGDPNHIQTQTPLPLPAPEDASTNKIDMSSGSGSISMDHLGPLVVNKDGTLSRISNWAEMSEIEKRNTMRILVKRNQIRTDELKAVQAQEGTDAERRAEEGS